MADHVAIMKKSWNLLTKIISGEKTIESRWYKCRFAPWDRIEKSDYVYFKNSGEKVKVKARVKRVLQFEDLNKEKIEEILEDYGDDICLNNKKYNKYYFERKYCILIFLENVEEIVKPFSIDKRGYGNASAWLVVEDINNIKKKCC